MTDQYSWVFVTSFGNCAIVLVGKLVKQIIFIREYSSLFYFVWGFFICRIYVINLWYNKQDSLFDANGRAEKDVNRIKIACSQWRFFVDGCRIWCWCPLYFSAICSANISQFNCARKCYIPTLHLLVVPQPKPTGEVQSLEHTWPRSLFKLAIWMRG